MKSFFYSAIEPEQFLTFISHDTKPERNPADTSSQYERQKTVMPFYEVSTPVKWDL